MNTISNHIAAIQKLAAQLTEAQNDHQQLDAINDSIQSISRRLSLEIEDTPSRFARSQFKKLGKDAVTLNSLAMSMTLSKDRYEVQPQLFRRELLRSLRNGIIPGIKKNKQWYATKDTLAEYYRELSRHEKQMGKLAA